MQPYNRNNYLNKNSTLYFQASELLSQSLYQSSDILSDHFQAPEVLYSLDNIVDSWNVEFSSKSTLIVNTWNTSGIIQYAGKTDVDDPKAKYSLHRFGLAFDLRCENALDNSDLYNFLVNNYKRFGFTRIRSWGQAGIPKEASSGAHDEVRRWFEDPPSYIHIDFKNNDFGIDVQENGWNYFKYGYKFSPFVSYPTMSLNINNKPLEKVNLSNWWSYKE